MMKKDIAQFKLSSGNEIVCEIIEWPTKEGDDLIVRNIMTILPYEFEGSIQYGFKPWLHYFESEEEYATLNTSHIIATARPNTYLQQNYFESVRDMNETSMERDRIAKYSSSIRRQQVEELIDRIKDGSIGDSDGDNIIPWPTFH